MCSVVNLAVWYAITIRIIMYVVEILADFNLAVERHIYHQIFRLYSSIAITGSQYAQKYVMAIPYMVNSCMYSETIYDEDTSLFRTYIHH